MERRAYVAGPMTGYDDFNRQKFAEAAAYVREVVGWEVVTPIELSEAAGKVWTVPTDTPEERHKYIRADIAELIDERTTDIVLIDGWKGSAGANLELAVAKGVGLTINLFTMGWFRSVRPDSDELHVYPAPKGLSSAAYRW